MKLYKRQIMPIKTQVTTIAKYDHHEVAKSYHSTPIVDRWFDETEEEQLREKYSHLLGVTERLEFRERFIPWIEDIDKAITVAVEEAEDVCREEEYSAINYVAWVLKTIIRYGEY